jgi:hypothetical protein
MLEPANFILPFQAVLNILRAENFLNQEKSGI